MVLPFGVGIGDFIAVANLTKNIVLELKKNTKATAHYQNLIVELESLGNALKRINEIKPSEHKLVHLDAIRASAAACRRPLAAFLEKLEKFESSMGTWNASDKRFKGLGRKVEYGLTLEGDVQELRSTLATHVGTINMLLLTQTLLSMTVAEDEQAKSSSKISKSTALLSRVKDCQDEINHELQNLKKALIALQQAVDQFKDAEKQASVQHSESNPFLSAQKEAVEELRKILKISGKAHGFETPSNQVTIDGSTSSEANTAKDDAHSMRQEFERLERELGIQHPHSAVFDNTQNKEANQISFLESTSKVLNLIFSGVIAAAAWTLMNQSQQIAQLSRHLINNCTATSGSTFRVCNNPGSGHTDSFARFLDEPSRAEPFSVDIIRKDRVFRPRNSQ